LRRLPELSGGRRRRTALCLGFACAATLSHAAAQSRLELTWDAPPECPQAPAVRQKVDALLGSAARKTGQLRASGRIVRGEGRYRLTLTVQEQNRPRNRTIDAETCDDLAGAAAVALGLLLRAESGTAAAGTSSPDSTTPNGANDTKSGTDANTRTTTDAQSAARDASKNPTASSTKTPAAASAAAAARADTTPETPPDRGGAATPRRWRVLLRAPVVHLDVARLPKPSVGFGAGAGFRYDEWSVGVSGRVYVNQTAWSNLATPDAGAVINRSVLELWTCRGFRSGTVELAPCLSVGLDHVVTRGTGADVKPQSARSTSVLIGVAGAGKFYLANWLALVATATLGLETARPKLTVGSLGEVQQLGPVAVSLTLGPEWIF
jgi:hypothetical protein